MMTEPERRLMLDLELFHDELIREWYRRACNDTQPTREDERRHILKLKKIILDHTGVDLATGEGYLK